MTMTTLMVGFAAGLVTLVAAGCLAFYFFLRRKYKFWEELGVRCPKPELLFGNMRPVFSLDVTETELVDGLYHDFPKQRFVGIYNLWKPVMIINDMDLVKQICENDFIHFMEHPQASSNKGTDGIMTSLFFLKGEMWRSRRQVLTRTFTPLRLKEYASDFRESLSKILQEIKATENQDIDIIHYFDRASSHFIAASFYGLDLSSDKQLTDKFMDIADIFSHPPADTVLKFLFYTVAPQVHEFLRLRTFPPRMWHFYSRLTRQLLDSRKGSDSRNDLITLMKKLMEEGMPGGEKIDFDEAVAHVYVWFLGSHHTTMLTICHTLLQLSLHQDCQEKVHKELDETLNPREPVAYEHLAKLRYLECVIKETLRLQPLLGVLKRVCTRNYRLSENLVVPAGTDIYIPAYSLQRDPNYFPDPDSFKPERFLEKDVEPAFMPFGKGPRICIGARFAMVMIKTLLASLLLEYKVERSDKMKFPMKMDPRTLFITNRPCGGIWVKFQRRTNC